MKERTDVVLGRGVRRHLSRKAKARAKRLILLIWSVNGHEVAADPVTVGRYARTPKPCSCPLCVNPRNGRSWAKQKRTMRELREMAVPKRRRINEFVHVR